MTDRIPSQVETPSTAHPSDAPATSPPVATPSAPPHPVSGPIPTPPGYEILCEIGEGGMGVVYRARHCALDRPVALKYLQPGLAHQPAAVARFLYEARITARLQHPGIPPVHEVGTLSDGRPFLAMKLIQGRTLNEMLREQGPHATRWLAVFESICQAVGYAHSEGVIHRDLKPGNVMVGAFGEVQVMDWGLAKNLAAESRQQPDVDDPLATTTDQPESAGSGSEPTGAGSVLGTPAFMPPEQAIGAIDRLDARSDVFGLGAILCVLLTGKPPFVAPNAELARQLAAFGRLDDAFARLDGCGAEPALVVLAKRCLSAEQDQRPRDGAELAAAVAGLRQQAEERARQAEVDRSRAEVQAAEQRKRRRLLLVAVGVVVGVLLAGLVGTSVGTVLALRVRDDEASQRDAAQSKQAEAEKARGEAEAAEGEAKKAQSAAETDRIKAEKVRDLARNRYQLALDAFNDMVFGIQNKLEQRSGTQELRKDLLAKARKGLQKLLKEAERQGNPDQTLVWTHFRMGDVELLLSNTQAARVEYEAGHELAKRLAEAAPKNAQAQRDLSASLDRMGNVSLQLGQTKEALAHFKASLRVARKLAEADPKNAEAQRDLSVSLDKMGDVSLQLGQTKEALAHFMDSLQVRRKLAQADPKSAKAQRDLSLGLDKMGDVSLLRLGQTKKALAHYKDSLEILQKLAEGAPKNAQAQRDLSASLDRMGNVSLQLGQTKEALAHFMDSLQIARKLAEADPNNAHAQRDLAVSLGHVGDVSLQLGQTKEALAHFKGSLEIFQKLAEADPNNAHAQRDLSVSLNNMGNVSLKLGQTKEALAHFKDSLQIARKLAEADPNSAQAQLDVFISYWKLGSAEKTRHDYATAANWFAKGRAVLLPLQEKKLLVGQAATFPTLVDQQIAVCKNAEKAVASLRFVFEQKPDAVAGLLDLRVRALLHHKQIGQATRTAECWRDWTRTLNKGRDDQRYDAACALALCAGASEQKDVLVSKTVALLTMLRDSGYFADAKRLAHFERDADFAAVRTHPAFAAFVQTLKSK